MEITLSKRTDETFAIPLQAEQVMIGMVPVNEVKLDKPVNRVIKRTVDIILGGFLLLVSLPTLLPLIAILIKLESKGPVFFLQKRTGLNGKSFYCYKFRSMVVNKDADRLQVQPGDKRITRFGHFLRNYYLDELPQLFNVMIGNMSLVGPRPLMLRHTVLYSRLVKNYHDRHLVKPGMTGLAQMRGYHGTVSSKQDLYDRCSSDIEYIKNWSLFGDLYIFFGTIVQTGIKLLWKKN